MKGKPVILVVGDEEKALELLQEILKNEHYTVLTADNGKEALEQAKRGRLNLVILDLKSSGMNEIEILRQLKRIDENIEVIVITGYGTMKAVRAAMKLGAYDYITKPFDVNYVRDIVKAALTPVSENLVQLELK